MVLLVFHGTLCSPLKTASFCVFHPVLPLFNQFKERNLKYIYKKTKYWCIIYLNFMSFGQVPEPLGWALMPVAPIGELFGWQFALELPNSQAGFKITGKHVCQCAAYCLVHLASSVETWGSFYGKDIVCLFLCMCAFLVSQPDVVSRGTWCDVSLPPPLTNRKQLCGCGSV